jgi:hypothetical protein
VRIVGVDFTSAPSPRKPITVADCRLEDGVLSLNGSVGSLTRFSEFERLLQHPGAWVAGFDFPFGQSREFLSTIDGGDGWQLNWAKYVAHVALIGKNSFVSIVKDYEKSRPSKAKRPLRRTDILAGSVASQQVDRPPVGKMFAEGAPRLLNSGVHVPLLNETGAERVVVEAYPGVVWRWLVDAVDEGLKNKDLRAAVLRRLHEPSNAAVYGVEVRLTDSQIDKLAEDPLRDNLDAFLCALQAAWAMTQRPEWGIPPDADAVEGWISDPLIACRHECRALPKVSAA